MHASVTRGLSAAAREITALVHAAQILIVIEDLQSRRYFRWDTAGGWGVLPSSIEPSNAYRDMYLFGSPGILAVKRRRFLWTNRYRCRVTAIDETGRAIDLSPNTLPKEFPAAHPFRRMVAVPLVLADELSGRMFVLDPNVDVGLMSLARFLQTLAQQVAPALFNVYLSNQLRAKAGALERARVARELHDGVIQSLIGLEMRLDVLRRDASIADTPVTEELARLQTVARQEVLALRELMQQMRPSELDPDELLDNLAELVERFGRETGMSARFACDLHDVHLPRRVCFELMRIVQEALVNIRKHSRASNVRVQFGLDDGHWSLVVEDDGEGFPFVGRLRLADLDASGRGPSIIRERVHAIGGELIVSSTPGQGSRLEVQVPQEIRA